MHIDDGQHGLLLSLLKGPKPLEFCPQRYKLLAAQNSKEGLEGRVRVCVLIHPVFVQIVTEVLIKVAKVLLSTHHGSTYAVRTKAPSESRATTTRRVCPRSLPPPLVKIRPIGRS